MGGKNGLDCGNGAKEVKRREGSVRGSEAKTHFGFVSHGDCGKKGRKRQTSRIKVGV